MLSHQEVQLGENSFACELQLVGSTRVHRSLRLRSLDRIVVESAPIVRLELAYILHGKKFSEVIVRPTRKNPKLV